MVLCVRLVSSAAVRKIRSPQRTGLESPRPGSAIFHTTFLLLLHCVGAFRLRLLPSSAAPRQQGQSASLPGSNVPGRFGGGTGAPRSAETQTRTARRLRRAFIGSMGCPPVMTVAADPAHQLRRPGNRDGFLL